MRLLTSGVATIMVALVVNYCVDGGSSGWMKSKGVFYFLDKVFICFLFFVKKT